MKRRERRISFSEKDYRAIVDIGDRLTLAKSCGDVEAIVRDDILPLLLAQAVFVGFHDVEMADMEATELMFTAGITEAEKELGLKILPYNKTIRNEYLISFRPVVAYDIDVPRRVLKQERAAFFSDHPEYDPKQYKVAGAHTGITINPHLNQNFIFSALRYITKPITMRDVRVLELIRPVLLQTVRNVFLRERLAHFKRFELAAKMLMDLPTALVIVDGDMRAVFLNTAFRALFPLEPGQEIPGDLARFAQAGRGEYAVSPFPDGLFYNHPARPLRVEVDFIERNILEKTAAERMELPGNADPVPERYCVLRLRPADDEYSKTLLYLREKGLSGRETEICVLLTDGIDLQEIADRLFISLTTVRTHLRNVYEKTGVHTRAQLTALLRKTSR